MLSGELRFRNINFEDFPRGLRKALSNFTNLQLVMSKSGSEHETVKTPYNLSLMQAAVKIPDIFFFKYETQYYFLWPQQAAERTCLEHFYCYFDVPKAELHHSIHGARSPGRLKFLRWRLVNYSWFLIKEGSGSVVGIATGYGLDGSGIEW